MLPRPKFATSDKEKNLALKGVFKRGRNLGNFSLAHAFMRRKCRAFAHCKRLMFALRNARGRENSLGVLLCVNTLKGFKIACSCLYHLLCSHLLYGETEYNDSCLITSLEKRALLSYVPACRCSIQQRVN